ncbi:MAG: M56 family metallopeptidase [Clostridia bacterium]|nr:M56 family metallopeptidase [Clostridia bacterium]
MNEVFLSVLNASLNACWLLAAAFVLRFILQKAPKSLFPFLWGIAFLRLLPFSFKSRLSVLPSAEMIPPAFSSADVAHITSGIEAVNERVNPFLAQSAEQAAQSGFSAQNVAEIAGYIWLTGAVILFVFTLISTLRLKKHLSTATRLHDNVFESEAAVTPFVFGFFSPKIYIPYNLPPSHRSAVLAHENAHIRRGDHWLKAATWLLLCLHWFNPLLWGAIVMLCRDIESACDERVTKAFDAEKRKDYAEALLTCSTDRIRLSACPIAFGETGVKQRIQNVIHYKKAPFWLVLIGILAVVCAAVCFLTDPMPDGLQDMEGDYAATALANTVTITMRNGEHEYTYDADEVIPVLERLRAVEIEKAPHSPNHSETRDRSFEIELTDANGYSTFIYFSSDCTQVWMDNNVKPTLSYAVFNPHIVSELFAVSNQNQTNGFEQLLHTAIQQHIPQHSDDTYYSTAAYEVIESGGRREATQTGVHGNGHIDEVHIYTIAYILTSHLSHGSIQTEHEEYKALLIRADVNENGTYALTQNEVLAKGNSLASVAHAFEHGIPESFTQEHFKSKANADTERFFGFTTPISEEGSTTATPVRIYVYRDRDDPMPPSLILGDDNTFQLTFGALSSYIATGSYTLSDNLLVLRTDDGLANIYTFSAQNNSFIFDATRSSSTAWFAGGEFADGAVFY